MKNKTLKTLIITLILIITIASNFSVFAATYFNGTSISVENLDNIEIISNTVTIDTVNSKIQNDTILKNTSNQAMNKTIKIKLEDLVLATNIKNLQIKVNQNQISKYENNSGEYSFNIELAPNEAKKIEIYYETENDLKEAKVIKYNFENLGIKDKVIKKAKVDIIIDENDIPLVKEIHPGHYMFQNNVISVEYYNFKVNSITKDVIVQKDTLKDLMYGREQELSELDKKILSYIPEWQKNGIKLNYSNDFSEYGFFRIDNFVERVIGLKVKDYNYKILESAEAIIDYYVTKALIEENKQNLINVSFINRPLLKQFMMENSDDVNDEELPLYGKTVCIDYVQTMQDKKLYVNKTTDIDYETYDIEVYKTELILEDEKTIITTQMYGNARVRETGAKLIFFGKDDNATEEEKVEYVNMINADMYIKIMLYDGEYEFYNEYGYPETYSLGYVGYAGEEDLEIAKAFYGEVSDNQLQNRGITEEQFYDMALKDNSADYVLNNLEIPAVIQYIGYVQNEDGKNVVNYFWNGFYDFYDRGLATTDEVLATNAGKAMIKQHKENLEKTKQQIEQEINSLQFNQTTTSIQNIVDNNNLETIILISICVVVVLIAVFVIILAIKNKG